MARDNFCTNCGAALTADAEFCGSCGTRVSEAITPAAAPLTDPRLRYKTVGINTMAVPWPLVYVTATILLLLTLFLLFVLLGGGVRHAWDEFGHGGSITFYNTTDTLLCYGTTPSSHCSAPIKPRAKSYWLGDCYGSGSFGVYQPGNRPRTIYTKSADCDDWHGAIVVINERDGELIVADSINTPTEPDIPAVD